MSHKCPPHTLGLVGAHSATRHSSGAIWHGGEDWGGQGWTISSWAPPKFQRKEASSGVKERWGSEDKVSTGCWPERWVMSGLGDSPLGKPEQPGGLPGGDKRLGTQVRRGNT